MQYLRFQKLTRLSIDFHCHRIHLEFYLIRLNDKIPLSTLSASWFPYIDCSHHNSDDIVCARIKLNDASISDHEFIGFWIWQSTRKEQPFEYQVVDIDCLALSRLPLNFHSAGTTSNVSRVWTVNSPIDSEEAWGKRRVRVRANNVFSSEFWVIVRFKTESINVDAFIWPWVRLRWRRRWCMTVSNKPIKFYAFSFFFISFKLTESRKIEWKIYLLTYSVVEPCTRLTDVRPESGLLASTRRSTIAEMHDERWTKWRLSVFMNFSVNFLNS